MAPLKTLLTLLLLAVLANGQQNFPGECPQQSIMELDKLPVFVNKGTWYEFRKYSNDFQNNYKCNSVTYQDHGNGTITFVERSEQKNALRYGPNHGILEVTGKLERSGQGQKLASFIRSYDGYSTNDSYNILDANDEYVIVWGCSVSRTLVNRQEQVTNTQTLYILTTERDPTKKVQKDSGRKVRRLLKQKNMEKLVKVDQNNCSPSARKED